MRVRPVRPVFTGAGGAVDFDLVRGVLLMSDLKQAAQTALEAWDRSRQWPFPIRPDKEFDALRAALAQPDPVEVREGWKYMREKGLLQEPMAWLRQRDNTLAVNDAWSTLVDALEDVLAQPIISPEIKGDKAEPVAGMYDYTASPQRKPLTVDQIYEVLGYGARAQYSSLPQYAIECVRAIEKAHGIGP